ncbi:PIN domain-containing protein [Thermosulfurimonas sp. F29]|uniref:PIN domain-containing protein n=1 Tax=Thermosulfurimonas sp. F29 TaxID=2867247 RepID=UPI001C838CD3|nr:PIN domain-containing protein [Thermosulfurimonas sp. F29]MBX6423446.1 PIN domain-containing protein [Thermosulfurimonas sp. F29]
MDRIFLDANVLFSAAYRSDSKLRKLWELKDVKLMTSRYALEEARINLETKEQRERLEQLVKALEIVEEHSEEKLSDEIDLPEKDRPILLAAIKAKATHLLTGDIRHFGKFFGRSVKGVLVLPPAVYFKAKGC